ncbi:MAG: bifunctional transaldolase/phosoglucose isomerase [Vicinamibacterales bacterium]|nr:transaldolase [Acidobacteriota bacterium]MDP7295285.1 bifunctional transaldolase/phosoglucose isomerase [Vicinamibacterales bacterium]MDP7671973.1 bifunctional transaldolase/phosoglucose isomerase [Vicinamibacterales bacterium]HJO39339.1 bifunctional transaldolase/phosoglucose isomerase [Vicinamibacterales bacterium]
MSDLAVERQAISGDVAFTGALRDASADWETRARVARLWAKDATLWTGGDEADWLGWLDIVPAQQARGSHFRALSSHAARGGFTDAVVLGMGGSSLCADVLSRSLGPVDGAPRLRVLDSTDPAQVASVEAAVDLERCLFIVASKSGTTLEPSLFGDYFYGLVEARLGDRAGEHFLAVTDPGSRLEVLAKRRRFHSVAPGVRSIGGRYSALSDFGLVPAAVMGLDVERLLACAAEMASACGVDRPVASNPGVQLGLALGLAARAGRDKVTFALSNGLLPLGAWLEQLLAESTGKRGLGLIPVDGEPAGSPEVYGADRVFVSIRLTAEGGESDDAEAEHAAAIDALEATGHPVVRITLGDRYDLAGEFFRWEIATAVAGAVLAINPFDQPDVEAGKVATRALTDAYETSGRLPSETAFAADDDFTLFADDLNREALSVAGATSPAAVLRAHLGRLGAGDYFALLAYLEMQPAHEAALGRMRQSVRDRTRAATCVGFGPRYLHSSGQAYKGGPNSGVFLQITAEDAVDLPIPGRAYSFGVVKAAQARGDFDVLAERKRRLLRVHLGADVTAGLASLERAVLDALA